MPLEYRELTGFADIVRANIALGQQHYDELVQHREHMPYDLDADKYETLEASGLLAAVGVYDGNTLVGYSANIITTHMHHKSTTCAYNDILFLAPAYRQGRAGLKLMAMTRELCARRGAGMMMWFARHDTSLSQVLDRRKGCLAQETIYSEPLAAKDQ